MEHLWSTSGGPLVQLWSRSGALLEQFWSSSGAALDQEMLPSLRRWRILSEMTQNIKKKSGFCLSLLLIAFGSKNDVFLHLLRTRKGYFSIFLHAAVDAFFEFLTFFVFFWVFVFSFYGYKSGFSGFFPDFSAPVYALFPEISGKIRKMEKL